MKISELTDSWASIDATKWTAGGNAGAWSSVANGELRIKPSTAPVYDAYLISVDGALDLTSSSFYARVTPAGSPAQTTFGVENGADGSATLGFQIYANDSGVRQLSMGRRANYTNVSGESQVIDYDPAAHAVLRVLHTGTRVEFYTAAQVPSATTPNPWTFRYGIAAPSWATAVKVNMSANKQGDASVTATAASFGPFNVQGASTTPPAAASPYRPYVDQPGGIGTAVTLKQGSSTGARLRLTGVNVWGVPCFDQYHADFANAQYSARTTVVNTVSSWGANVVRLRVDALGNSYNASAWGLSQTEYINRIKTWVDLITAKGMYVMLTWWDAYNAAGNWATRYTETFDMYTAVRSALGDNPYVIYEIGNEPNNVTWSQWNTAVRGTIAHFRDTLKHTGLLAIDTITWSHGYSDTDMTGIETYDAARTGMGGKHAIMFTRHDYGNEYPNRTWDVNKWKSETGGTDVDHLIHESEFGNYNVDTPSGESWARGISAYFAGQAFTDRANFCGSTAFLFGPWVDNNNPDSNGMTKSDNVTYSSGTYSWGSIVDNVLLASGAVTTPTPSAALATLTDTFATQSAQWAFSSGTRVTASTAHITPANGPADPSQNYRSISSVARYTGVSSQLALNVTCAAGGTSPSTTVVLASTTGGTDFTLDLNGDTKLARLGVRATYSHDGASVAEWTWTDGARIRITESGGFITAETSTDATTWTQQKSKGRSDGRWPTPSWWNNVQVSLGSSNQGGSSTDAVFDSVNVVEGVVTQPGIAASTFMDDFDVTAMDTTKWTKNGSPVEANSVLSLNLGDSYRSVPTLNMTGDSIYFDVVGVPTTASSEAVIRLETDANNAMEWVVRSGVAYARVIANGALTVVGQVPYNGVQTRYLRLRADAAGKIFFDYGPSQSYSTLVSGGTTAPFPVIAMRAILAQRAAS